MPYVTSIRTIGQHKITLEELWNGTVTPQMMQIPEEKTNTETRTTFYKRISPQMRSEALVPQRIAALQAFYERFKHLDIDDKWELYDHFSIPKASGGLRKIDAPKPELMECLRQLSVLLSSFMVRTYHTAAYAYIAGRCAKDSVIKHQRHHSRWFLKTDFTDFFGSTTPEFVMRMFEQIYPFSEIIGEDEGHEIMSKCLSLCFLKGGLPQGTPISPLITNIMMIPIDHALSNGLYNKSVSKDSGVPHRFIYTRYADDICVSNRIDFTYSEIIDYINKTLVKFDAPFTIKPSKTKYGSNAGKNWILGVMLNKDNEITIGHKKKKLFKAMLTNYMMDRANGHPWEVGDIQELAGKMSYYRSVEQKSIDEIVDRYSVKFGDIRQAIKADLNA